MARLFLAAVFLLGIGVAHAADVVSIRADPPQLKLDGPSCRWTLLVQGKTSDGNTIDLTSTAKVTVADAKIVELRSNGGVRGAADGTTTLRVEAAGHVIGVPVSVTNTTRPRDFHFETDIQPIFGRFGCSSAGCHGKAEGQNGFKLSVFGYDPPADYAALVKDGRGRRIFPAAPAASLLLTKATGKAAHGGGAKIAADSTSYETLRAWIAAAAPMGSPDAPKLLGLRAEPGERVMGFGSPQQLRIVAKYSDGHEADVTNLARYQSNRDEVAVVSPEGLITTRDVPGEAAVMAAYLNEVAVFRAIVPRPGPQANFSRTANNFIDPLVDAKLRKLNVAPSDPVDDAEFLRRVSLDIIGTLPTPAEARAFLADKSANKRAKLVDALLERPEYADLWALKWSDLLRVDRTALGPKRAYAYYRWVRHNVAANVPFDRMARELVTAEGPLDEVSPANFYLAVKKPGEIANSISQVFLGIRVTCAECHHHPFDRWGQEDYAGMAAFFTSVSVKKVAGTDALAASGKFTAKHPRTGASIPAAPLGAPPVNDESPDARIELADWMTSPGNPYFARNLVNRVWTNFFGPGLVEPVDDVRGTNPPSNPELLDALAKYAIDSKFDVRQLIRTVTASKAYQTSCRPNGTNAKDERSASRALFRPVPAEVFADMIATATGVPETYSHMPAGTRAIQLWDSQTASYLLKTFGRPVRMTACECERVSEPTLTGVLHTLNSDELADKLRHDGGTVARLTRTIAEDDKLAEELVLTFFSRFPTASERATIVKHMKSCSDRRRGAEDIAWALMNTREFQQNH